MNLDLEPTTGKNFIQSYTAGKIKINDTIFNNSVIISADCLESWNVESFKEISKDNLKNLLQHKPEVILIGSGKTPHFLSADFLLLIQEQKVGIETMTTEAACRTFNVMLNEGRNVLAALIV